MAWWVDGHVRQVRLYCRSQALPAHCHCGLFSVVHPQALHMGRVYSSLVQFTSFNYVNISKKVKKKKFCCKSRWFTNHPKVNAYFSGHLKIENQFARTEKIHETRRKSEFLFTIHSSSKSEKFFELFGFPSSKKYAPFPKSTLARNPRVTGLSAPRHGAKVICKCYDPAALAVHVGKICVTGLAISSLK